MQIVSSVVACHKRNNSFPNIIIIYVYSFIDIYIQYVSEYSRSNIGVRFAPFLTLYLHNIQYILCRGSIF